jgi:hypothetical protein
VQCPEDDDGYISEFKKSECILLEKENISFNPAKHGLAKLCLNSKWGKLTERNNRNRTKMITDQQELYRFHATPGVEVAALVFASDIVVCALWRHTADEKVHNLRHTNEVIGAFATTGAGIHLYKYLNRLKQKAHYSDTNYVHTT